MAAPIRVLELYSGIGGMHCALQASGIPYDVVQAMDVNTVANQIYTHNFPDTKVIDRSIEVLTTAELDKLKIDMILMSPPCQPFTRVGKKLDTEDVRTKSFLHLLSLLTRLKNPVSYVLVENVKGFETSDARDHLVDTLEKCNFQYQEMLLTPLQLGIPNSRMRYFLIGKKKPCQFSFQTTTEVMTEFPSTTDKWLKYKADVTGVVPPCRCLTRAQVDADSTCDPCSDPEQTEEDVLFNKVNSGQLDSKSCDEHTPCKKIKLSSENVKDCADGTNICQTVPTDLPVTNSNIKDTSDMCPENFGDNLRQTVGQELPSHRDTRRLEEFLEIDTQSDAYFEKFLLPNKDLKRFVIMDIISPCSRKSTCFTKRYGHYVEGAGSVVQMSTDPQDVIDASEFKKEAVEKKNRDQWGDTEMSIIRKLRLRYFTPTEIANILCFPKSFSFPPGLSNKQQYRVLGNSLNVHVVSVLINVLLELPKD